MRHALIRIENDGPVIASTNYFQTDNARAGYVFCSTNAGCLRLLCPDPSAIDPAGAQYVIVTRGKYPARDWRECMEFVWEDGSDSPFHLIFEAAQTDRLPAPQDAGRTDLRCIGYGPDLAVLFDLPARYRVVPRIPCLKPWK